jgi:hypothetical protein
MASRITALIIFTIIETKKYATNIAMIPRLQQVRGVLLYTAAIILTAKKASTAEDNAVER